MSDEERKKEDELITLSEGLEGGHYSAAGAEKVLKAVCPPCHLCHFRENTKGGGVAQGGGPARLINFRSSKS